MIPRLLDRALRPLRRGRLVEHFDPQFPAGDAAYNSLGRARDGRIVFAVGSKRIDAGARLYTLAGSTVRLIADLDEVLPRPAARSVPQGKVHVDFVDIDGLLYGATHVGYYDPHARTERPGVAPGYAPYPGGWFFALDGDRVVPLAQAPRGEGIIAMSADVARRRLFALTWPGGRFLTLDVPTRALRDYGPVLGAAETGSKRRGTWGRVCRSLGVDPGSGDVFWCDDGGRIARFHGESIEMAASMPRREMWRKVVWHQGIFYGIVGRSATLFRFDPASRACEEIASLGRGPATLAFALRGHVVHALDRAVSHVAYDLDTGTKTVSGPLRLADGRWVTQAQSLLIDDDIAYSICWVRGAREELVLVRFSVA